jgi:hypothetical protein
MALFDSGDSAASERGSVQSRFFPNLNHRFIPAEGGTADAKDRRPEDVDLWIIDTIVGWAMQTTSVALNAKTFGNYQFHVREIVRKC